MGALPGEAILGCQEEMAELNLVSWILRWKVKAGKKGWSRLEKRSGKPWK